MNRLALEKLSERDKKHLWHPLTQHKLHPEAIALVKAKGSLLFDEDGNTYIDGFASWYTCMYGHCNDYILNKVKAQIEQLDQVVFSGFTHKPAIELSEKLMAILPDNQQKLFFSDNGSTAVEVGIKMALQYHFNQGNKKNVLVAFDEGFHGDTFGAMSVSGLSVYNGPFEDFFISVQRIPVPNGENNADVLNQLKAIVQNNEVAAFVYEPLVQGAAAMKMHDTEGLEELLRFCKSNDVICIADEVMTGFGKTGRYFASDYMATKPDIMCLSKALTAGLLPMALTTCTQDVYDAFYSDDRSKGFFHGHTYSANPLACATAVAGIELLVSSEIQSAIKMISDQHKLFSEQLARHSKVKSTRHLGVIFALDLDVEMERYGSLRDKLYKAFMDRGVYLRPLGNTIYIMPPYTILDDELQKIYKTVEEVIEML